MTPDQTTRDPATRDPAIRDKGNPELTASCRAGDLVLRQLKPSDVTQDYIDWMNVPEIVRFTEQKHRRHTRASVTEFASKIQKSGDYLFGVFHDGRHLGNVGLGPIDWNHRRGEIGYIIGRREYWGKGVATAAVVAVAEFALGELGLEKLCAEVFEGNGASMRVLEKAGFTVEARLPGHVVLDGGRVDQFMLGRHAG